MPFYLFGDSLYVLIVIVTFVIGLLADAGIKSTYARWSKVHALTSGDASEVARRMLDAGGASDVTIVRIAGQLTDHYDPKKKELALSEGNFGKTSVAALAVACHEAGHAVQHAKAYAPLKWRTALVPVVQFSQSIWVYLLIAGIWLNIFGLVQIGVVLFGVSVLFHVVTLPVELDASRRALAYIKKSGNQEDVSGARAVLFAAAMTYVVSALTSITYLVYMLNRANQQRR